MRISSKMGTLMNDVRWHWWWRMLWLLCEHKIWHSRFRNAWTSIHAKLSIFSAFYSFKIWYLCLIGPRNRKIRWWLNKNVSTTWNAIQADPKILIRLFVPFDFFSTESFHKHPMEIDLTQACVGELNTIQRGEINWPIIYGVGVNIRTGEIFPASFPDKGPDIPLRQARNFTGGQTVCSNLCTERSLKTVRIFRKNTKKKSTSNLSPNK